MPSALPSTEVFAFSAPKIKGAELHVAVNLGAGSLHVLRATRSVWRNLFERLQGEFQPIAPEPAPPNRAARLAGLRAARALWEGGGCKQSEAAARHGVPYGTFVSWLKAERRKEEAAARGPVTKPGGQLL